MKDHFKNRPPNIPSPPATPLPPACKPPRKDFETRCRAGEKIDSVFIVVDASDIYDEGKFLPLGVFLSQGAALEALEGGPGGEWETDAEEICTVEIWERKIGFSGLGKRVFVGSWEQDYDEDLDAFTWGEIEPNFPHVSTYHDRGKK